ncbi:transesterase [Camillea tinctor]|nr:transesterase [Camillea tinctor]
MEQVDKLFKKAVADGLIHGAVLVAKDLTGKIDISRSYGVRSLRKEVPEKRPPMTVDTPMWVASLTKLVTSIIVLQCVEKGLVDLDESIERLLPEVAAFKVLTGFDSEGQPIEREPKSPILVRHLLCHSSGIAYADTSPLLQQYRQWQGIDPSAEHHGDTLEDDFSFPLIFDPGMSFAYGPSLDWAGRLAQRAAGVSSLEELLQRDVVARLGLSPDEMTFALQSHPGARARRADMTVRDSDTGALHCGDEWFWHRDAREPHGGQGLFTSAAAYARVLWSVLADDGVLLKPETRRLLFEPALTPQAEASIEAYCAGLGKWSPMAPLPAESTVRRSHSVGGLVLREDFDGDRWRRKGNLSWAGMPNMYWNIDQETGLFAVWGFELRPWADPISVDLGRKFEEILHAELKK